MELTACTLVALGLLCSWAFAARALYVAPDGADDNPGTKAKPLATLMAARDAVRKLRAKGKLPAGGVAVWVRGGTYELDGPLELDARDSGTKDGRIVYRAVAGEPVRLMGGRLIPPSAFEPVRDKAVLARLDEAARGKVRQCDLKKLGIRDLGALSRGALHGGPMLELFFNDRAMPISRWPNKGWAKYGRVIDKGSIPRWAEKPDRPGVLEYTGDRPKRWAKAPEIFLHGYWHHDWYDDVLKVAKLDAQKRRITFTTPHTYGLRSGRRYAALNLLEEIDSPGEWVLDRTSGVLYLYPPGAMAKARIAVSMLAEPMVTLKGASHVTLRGLTFEVTRGSAVAIRGGTDNLVAGCTVRNVGTSAVQIRPLAERRDGPVRLETGDPVKDGRRNGVVGCDLYEIGTSGISLVGGDRRTLAPAGHYAVNNDIHHYSRRKRTNCPAIGISGVGNRMAHNFIHDAPHCGVFYSGNEHVIEFNEATRLCWETGDVGVFYSGRNWTFRGNVVRHNFLHHIQAPGSHGSMAVYLDDSHSSTKIVGNVFYKVQRAAFIGGGRDNVVDNNIFLDCGAAVHLDNRSQGWAHKYQKPGGDHRMYGKLKDVRHDQPPWSARYPKLARILKETPHAPLGNVVTRNVCVRGRWLNVYRGGEKLLAMKDNFVTTGDPGFVDAEGLDFQLRDDSAVYKKVPGFRKIPFEKIGLYVDEYRKSLPLEAPRIRPAGGPVEKQPTSNVQR
ncbi:MAG: right-handed parallel beta-helix repeat-containing protein [Phycisphaerae bacterium]|nr:right-handed parallel beta-helix repeat-containing protein [Phycisphaerae bacterium]